MIKIHELEFPEVKLLQLKVHFDDRGFFTENYQKFLYEDMGIEVPFVQDNHSFSTKGIIRGMHFQSEPGQAKLISVIVGAIYDVFVDIRPHSPTFGKWSGYLLESEKHEQLFIPVGFAHGFAVVSEGAHVMYKVSSVFNPHTEKSFHYNDSKVGIKWPVAHPILSEKDRSAPKFNEVFCEDLDFRC